MDIPEAKQPLPPPIVVTDDSALASLVDRLSSQPVIAVDTESNSLYAYQEQVCLIQFSIPGTDYLVDPLSDLDPSPLGAVFFNPKVEKVFHAAEYDVICLRRDFGWDFANLFDTMWAARVLGWPRSGLGNILEEKFGVHLNKRWQRHDWGQRPLSPKALAYARLDTHYLIALRNHMLAELREKGRVQEAREFFVEVAQAESNHRSFDPNIDLWRVKGVWDLEPETRAILRELVIWRDAEARRRNRPPFKILADPTLVELAAARPRTVEELEGINGFKAHHRRRYGRKIIKAVANGTSAKPPSPPPRPPRPPDDVLERYEALRRWRKKTASQRSVEPDVVVSNAVLWELAQNQPRSPRELADLNVLGAWKQGTYGEALLKVLHKHS
jgi:ribonuclease D